MEAVGEVVVVVLVVEAAEALVLLANFSARHLTTHMTRQCVPCIHPSTSTSASAITSASDGDSHVHVPSGPV